LHEETDYLREWACLNRFRDLLAGAEGFVLPRVYDDWSTDSVLAMEYLAGRPVEEAAQQSADERNRIMQRLVELTLKELFEFKLMQSDPNFANYRYDPETGSIILLDFGATREISEDISMLYRAMFSAGLLGQQERLEELTVSLGFIDETIKPEHRARVLRLIGMAFDGLRVPVFDFNETTLTRQMQRQGEALARDGFVPPVVPMDVLYLQRKFGGMFLLGSKLGAKLPVADMLAPYLDA